MNNKPFSTRCSKTINNLLPRAIVISVSRRHPRSEIGLAQDAGADLTPEVRDNVEKSEYEDMFCDNLDKVQNVIKLCDISF